MRFSLSLSALLGLTALLAACDDKDSTGSSTTGSGGAAATTTTTSGDTTATSGTGGAPPVLMRKTIAGDATWSVTFDDAAKMAGATDCSYTRHYEGVEDRSAPWLCPTCTIMYKADVTVTAGAADCFPQVSESAPPKLEWIGYKDGTWWRSAGFPMTAQGTVTGPSDKLVVANTVTDLDASVGGKMQFEVAGTFAESVAEGDPLNGFVAPSTYACGWPKADPPAYTGDYTIVKGQTVPDGLFKDKCDEPVRLHDFKGTYLVIDMAAVDCPPCQAMAGGEEKFVADMKAKGIDVKMITLLAPSLADPVGTTSKGKLNNWTTKYMLTSPVLGDRAWGQAMFEPIFTDQLGYPSWVVVDPDLKVVETGVGFADFTDFDTIITTDAQ
ncbi:MAG: redoxin domain-containing protein [Polyangiaceae bacterium]